MQVDSSNETKSPYEYAISDSIAEKLVNMRASFLRLPEPNRGDENYFPSLLAKEKIKTGAQDLLQGFSPGARKEITSFLSGELALEGLRSVPARDHQKVFGEFREAYKAAKNGTYKIHEENFLKRYCKSRGLGVSSMDTLRFISGHFGTAQEFSTFAASRPAHQSRPRSQGRKL